MSHKALIRRFHIHSLLFEDSGRPWSRPLREEPVVMTYDAGYIKSGSWFIMFLKSQPAAQLRQCVNRTAIKRSVTCHQSCLYSETSLPSAVVIRFHPQTVQEYHSLYMCQSNSADTYQNVTLVSVPGTGSQSAWHALAFCRIQRGLISVHSTLSCLTESKLGDCEAYQVHIIFWMPC